MSKMPKRILILSILIIIFSLYGLGSTITSMLNGSLTSISPSIPTGVTFTLNLIGAVLSVLCGIGFLLGKKKARTFYTWYMAITSLMGAITILIMPIPDELAQNVSAAMFKFISIAFLGLMVSIPIIILFTKKSSKYFAKEDILAQNLAMADGETEVPKVEAQTEEQKEE